ncbi:hypothetical protein PROFUN_16713 [Planoprotostelium fungivorum]|uniref:Uncharacterized protein n=1 Tax=Planoprotostelium fungivorum TaxID=1890364 RepID=A0A2P6MPS7_9EUKA|nr:hypothetical protein PROFUN_16713 [Planoprotostelium fungivorum]
MAKDRVVCLFSNESLILTILLHDLLNSLSRLVWHERMNVKRKPLYGSGVEYGEEIYGGTTLRDGRHQNHQSQDSRNSW